MQGIVTGPDGAPRPGVGVSNGRQVIATDSDGRFELPDEGAFVILVRPTGYTANPWWVRATDREIRFGLATEEQRLPYHFLHLTDTHLTVPVGAPGRDEVDKADFGLHREGTLPRQIESFLGRLHELAPEAASIMITGDLVDHGLAPEFASCLEVIAKSPVPVHLIPGNHDHMTEGRHGSVISRNNYLINTGHPARYEEMVGPRWYSFDVAGLHVAAMDWHTHELGIDHEKQNEWLRNDLTLLEPGAPWILLFHDQPGHSLLDSLPWQPIAAFSGHWHASRVVEIDGTLHVNSPTTFFASLDYSPPAFRSVTWDGSRITLRTQTLLDESVEVPAALGEVSAATFRPSPRAAAPAVRWRAQLDGAGHRQPVAVDADRVFAGSQIEDRPAGSIAALDLASGDVLWSSATRSAVKAAPVVHGDLVIAAEVSGDVAAWNRETGEQVWRTPSSDPLRRFAWGAPALDSGRVYVGDQADLRCLDAATGEVIWRRTDLAPHHNLVQHAAPLIVDDLLVMGFWPTPQHPVGLDTATGESRWPSAALDPDQMFTDVKQLLVMGTAAYDPDGDAIVLPTFRATFRVARADGARLWLVDHTSTFNPSTPIPAAAGIVVTIPGHGMRMLDRGGEVVWDLEIDGVAPFPMSSYTKTPHPVLAPPVLIDETLVLPGLDGVVRRIDLTGRVVGATQLGAPLAAPLTNAGDLLVGVGVDGGVIALDRGVAS